MTEQTARKYALAKIKEFEETKNCKVLYCTMSGSKLYGTDNPNSDFDFKAVFAPSQEDVLLKKDLVYFDYDTNKSKEKNSNEDVDMSLSSVYKFVDELKQSETGATDVLFSMFREDTQVYADETFVSEMKANYQAFANKNMKAFVGYALGQSQRFGVKGARYAELDKFVALLDDMSQGHPERKLKTLFPVFEKYFKDNDKKYLKMVMAPGARGTGTPKKIPYVSVLGKLYEGNVTFLYTLERVRKMHSQFGNRTRSIAKTTEKTDFKALSHALRVAYEVEELLETNFITFPLLKAKEVLEVKEGRVDTQVAVEEVTRVLDRVDELLLSTSLPDKANEAYCDEVKLKFLV